MADAPRPPKPTFRATLRTIAADAIRDRAAEYEREVAAKSARLRTQPAARAALATAAQLRLLADQVEYDA